MRVLDFLTHTGHQYEFAKVVNGQLDMLSHDPSTGLKAWWDAVERPQPKNLIMVFPEEAIARDYDAIICRQPRHANWARTYKPSIPRIAVIGFSYPVESKFPTSEELFGECAAYVWNSEFDMVRSGRSFKDAHILHGFDPEEWELPIGIQKKNKILYICNAASERDWCTGYVSVWKRAVEGLPSEIVGHNPDLETRRAKDFQELVEIYHGHSIYFNATIASAMPRGRSEATMCGLPIVSTHHYGAERYVNEEFGFIGRTIFEWRIALETLLDNQERRERMGRKAREFAIEHFHIDRYKEDWKRVFEVVIR